MAIKDYKLEWANFIQIILTKDMKLKQKQIKLIN